MKVSLVDLSDRDAVILEVGGEALVSDLVVHKLRPNRLEAYFQYQGEPAVAPVVKGDLITAVEITKRPEGFLMTLALADGVQQREAVYQDGAGWRQDRHRGSFRRRRPAPFQRMVGSDGGGLAAPVPAPASLPRNSTHGERAGAAVAESRMKYQSEIPARVDVALMGQSSQTCWSGAQGHGGDVTYVEVIRRRAGGMVVG
jgi:hypothetical protein